MKKKILINLCLSSALILACVQTYAQFYIPLRIDSLHSWGQMDGFEGDTSIHEYFVGYSYDANDSLIQQRHFPNRPDITPTRFSYSYAGNTSYMFGEQIDAFGVWQPFTSTTSVFEGGKIVSKRNDDFVNNSWSNSALYTFQYNTAGSNTAEILELWENNEWKNFYKKEIFYDAQENATEQNEYYADDNGVLKFNRGERNTYDHLKNKIQNIHVNSSINGPYNSSKTEYTFGSDNVLDSFYRCHFSYSTGVCKNIVKATYDYMGNEVIHENAYSWLNNEWNYYGKESTFRSAEIYSDRPDSVIFFSYDKATGNHAPTTRRYITYEELGNNRIYFKDITYDLQQSGNWKQSRLIEAWYHLQKTVSIGDDGLTNTHPDIFPNPAAPHQQLTINSTAFTGETFEVSIFNSQGIEVSRSEVRNGSAFTAPGVSGMYTILLRENGNLIGLWKQVVLEKD